MWKRLRFLRYLLEGLCLVFVGMGLSFFCERCTEGFTLSRLDAVLPNDPQWELSSPALEDEALFQEALKQSFHYLGRGGQCFAFASEDGKYVMKFINNHWRRPQQWWLSLPWPSSLKKSFAKPLNRIVHKRNRDFCSYRLSFEELKRESGLICVHLNKTDHFCKKIKIIDKLCIAHLVDLDATPFILQKRAQKIYPYIEEKMKKGDLMGASQAISQVLELIVKRCQKGVFDEDPKLHANIGLLQEGGQSRPIFIDIGRFKRDPTRQLPEVYHKDLEALTQRFRAWLQENYPSLLPTLDEGAFL